MEDLMKFKDLIIEHPDGLWELKQTLKVKTLTFESTFNSGRKFNSRMMSTAYGEQPKNLLEKELKRNIETNSWEMRI